MLLVHSIASFNHAEQKPSLAAGALCNPLTKCSHHLVLAVRSQLLPVLYPSLLLAEKTAIKQSASRAVQQLRDNLLCESLGKQRVQRSDALAAFRTQMQGSQQRDHLDDQASD